MARLIKRYPNRKLYDTQESVYVTLAEIWELVKSGERIKVLQNKSGEDVTVLTLLTALVEKKKPVGNNGLLKNLSTVVKYMTGEVNV